MLTEKAEINLRPALQSPCDEELGAHETQRSGAGVYYEVKQLTIKFLADSGFQKMTVEKQAKRNQNGTAFTSIRES